MHHPQIQQPKIQKNLKYEYQVKTSNQLREFGNKIIEKIGKLYRGADDKGKFQQNKVTEGQLGVQNVRVQRNINNGPK